MIYHLAEANYPFDFRKKDTINLSKQIENRRNVVFTGMKRVGISNFLRYFLYHPGIKEKYLKSNNHLFIPVDLNDLVEREIYPFWVLTFKRTADVVDKSKLPEKIKKQVETYFLDSIQSQDLFLTIDNLRKSLVLITENDFLPTIFFLRFDRLKDATTQDLFANFQGLVDATHQKLSYVFTSNRTLDHLVPEVFTKQSVNVFADNLYIKPAEKNDSEIIFESSVKENKLNLKPEIINQLLNFVDGHTQYLLFALISLSESKVKIKSNDLFKFLKQDERIALQSEELWESLSNSEQDVLLSLIESGKLNIEEINKSDYLINTGFFDPKTFNLFSPLFEFFVKSKLEEKRKDVNSKELSKKENELLRFLESNLNEVCEREEIIEAVWPEAEEIGVTDWAIDRLIARLRSKLDYQKKDYEIVTIKTRGYKLVIRS